MVELILAKSLASVEILTGPSEAAWIVARHPDVVMTLVHAVRVTRGDGHWCSQHCADSLKSQTQIKYNALIAAVLDGITYTIYMYSIHQYVKMWRCSYQNNKQFHLEIWGLYLSLFQQL